MMRAGLFSIAAMACSSPAPPVAPSPPATTIDAGADSAAAIDAAIEAPLTAEECGRYVDHVVTLAAAAVGPTFGRDELTTVRERLIAEQPCRDLSRPMWTCALAARDQPALYACGGGTSAASGQPR